MSEETQAHIRTCPLCEAMCGLRLTVENNRVLRIRPNHEDVWSKGYICPKGTVLGDVHEDPDRLRAPLVRDGEGFREVSWPEAFAEAERRLRPVLARGGLGAVATYIGNPTAHNFSLSRYVPAFVALSGIDRIYSAGTVDQWPMNVTAALMYGGMWTFPTPDIDRTDYLMVLGANPQASQGSLLAAPDVLGRLDGIRARGGRVVVVDPRRTGTADRASEWVPIRPGTDAAFLLAMLHVLFTEGLADPRHLGERVAGLEDVRRRCADFPPQRVEEVCGIPAEAISRLAHEVAAAPSAAVYGRIGTCTQEFGTLASWLVQVLNVVTGNLDRPGGMMFANPIAWSLTSMTPPEFAEGFTFGRWKSRVRGAPEVLGQVPVSCLAEEISTPGAGKIEALITIAGNPVLSAPGAPQIDRALTQLDCMISVDNWLNETSRHADVILPGLSSLEQPHYDELIWSWAVRNAGKYSEALFPPPPERPREWEVLLTLVGLLQGQTAAEADPKLFDELYFGGLVGILAETPGSAIHGRDAGEIVAAAGAPGPERLLDFQIRTGPWGDAYGARPDGLTLEAMRAAPNGVDKGALEPRLGEVLRTSSGKIELAPDYIVADLPRLEARLERPVTDLVLVSRRHLRSNNSWMHNVPALMTGRDRCTLLMHPEDARRHGVADGGQAEIRSSAGRIVAPVEVSREMMPGVVCLPHGWGHDKAGTRLSVAGRRAGVCNNDIAPGEFVDVPSGNAAVNGIPVEVSPA